MNLKFEIDFKKSKDTKSKMQLEQKSPIRR